MKDHPEEKNLIPKKNLDCDYQVDPIKIVHTWKPYQETLKRLVRQITGKTIKEVYSENVIDLFYKVLTKDFKGVSPIEVSDVTQMLPMLYECYPEEYEIARKKSAGSPVMWK